MKDNPASNLLNLLKLGKQLDTNLSTKIALKKLFKIDDNTPQSEVLLISRLGLFLQLPLQIKTLASQYYPDQVSDLDHTISAIHNAFLLQNMTDKWSSFINRIDSHAMSALSMFSVMLDIQLQTKHVSDSELNDFNSKITNLIDEITHSEVSDEFKKFIWHYLNKIKLAIENYFITGTLPILDSIESIFGHAVIDPKFKSELVDSDVGKNISSTLADLASIVTVATGAYGAVEFLSNNLSALLQ